MKYNVKPEGSEKYRKYKPKENYEGAMSFGTTPKLELYKRVVAGFMGEPKYYESSDTTVEELKKVAEEVVKEDADFVARLAIKAREDYYMRQTPLFLLSVLANNSSSFSGERKDLYKAVARTIKRADELAELLAMNDHFYPRKKTGKTRKIALPMMLKKGIALAFGKFNEYQLAKYNRSGVVKLKDVLSLVHPKPKDEEQSKLWKRLLDGELKVPETWETVISTKGSTKENWQEILPKMPIMAFIRNLRNLLGNGVDITEKIAYIKENDIIRKSKMFPFRFFSAYRELLKRNLLTDEVREFLEYAVDKSIENIDLWAGRNLVVIDVSGSMDWAVSNMSTVIRSDISTLMGAIMHTLCEKGSGTVVGFGSDFDFVNLDKVDGVIKKTIHMMKDWGIGDFSDSYKSHRLGHGTDASKVMNHIIKMNLSFDRIILLTDMQIWAPVDKHYRQYYGTTNSLFFDMLEKYRNEVNPNVRLYQIDLGGYGDLAIPEDYPYVINIAGWSDKIFMLMKILESKPDDVIASIMENTDYENYELK